MTKQKHLRTAFGNFGTGVVIVTLAPVEQLPIGLTVNSFASVSLEPPLLSWCLARDSDMFETMIAAQRFGISILAADQLEFSSRLAMPGQHTLQASEFTVGEHGDALIKGALAHFECHVYKRVEAGDHVIFIGRIDGTHYCPQQRPPLLYFRSTYGELTPKNVEKG